LKQDPQALDFINYEDYIEYNEDYELE
jgi:hypothetical protein